MRRAVAVLAAIIAAPHCSAATLTCVDFKERLAKAIHQDGDRVAQPTRFEIAFSQTGNPHVRYKFGGIVGLEGSLNCVEDDAFQNIDVNADIDSGDPVENGRRLLRIKSLMSASLAVVAGASLGQARRTLDTLFDKSYREFAAEKRRGEESPGGDEYQDLPDGSQLEVTIVPQGASIVVWAPRK